MDFFFSLPWAQLFDSDGEDLCPLAGLLTTCLERTQGGFGPCSSPSAASIDYPEPPFHFPHQNRAVLYFTGVMEVTELMSAKDCEQIKSCGILSSVLWRSSFPQLKAEWVKAKEVREAREDL